MGSWVSGWIDEGVDGWADGGMDGQTDMVRDHRLNGQIVGGRVTDSSIFGWMQAGQMRGGEIDEQMNIYMGSRQLEKLMDGYLDGWMKDRQLDKERVR